MPWIHSLFENPAAIASGIRAAMDSKKAPLSLSRRGAGGEVKIIAQGGDGATFDIGFGLISGMWERGEDILYICYDNEAYMNTGIQASGATPWAANTTTTPSGSGPTIDAIGSHQRKKDMIAIALAHGLNYVAQTTIGYPFDVTNKIKAALKTKGPSYVQILVPCVPGWKIAPDQAINLGKLASQTGLYPLLEYINGELVKKSKATVADVTDYLKSQGRFKHLFKSKQGAEQLKHIQELANQNIKKYGLK